VIPCEYTPEGDKVASPQRLLDSACYPEHLMYLKSAGLCGQADLVHVSKGEVHIGDYKTNKEIKTKGFVNWEGIKSMLRSPVAHLEDCHYSHYNLQLSIYMYMVLKHNPHLKPGSITIYHVSFESLQILDPETGEVSDATDEYGYPVHALDAEGNPTVKDVSIYEMPYLKAEAQTLVAWLERNKDSLLNQYRTYKAKEAEEAAELAR
jgi:hypothetical protein